MKIKLLWGMIVLMWVVWSADYFYFRYAGPRFTAHNGQDLCIVIHEIAKYSIGYQQSGLPMPQCEYGR